MYERGKCSHECKRREEIFGFVGHQLLDEKPLTRTLKGTRERNALDSKDATNYEQKIRKLRLR